LKDSNLPAIFHLRVSQNFITVFPAECNLLGLKKIDVSHNQLTDLSTIVNKKFKELEEVNASHNKITSIGKIKSKTLRKLDISFNNINLDTDETSPFHSSAVPQLEEIAIKQQSDGRVFTDAEVLESVERVIPLLKLIK
jgi:Leucine-rich repeat (LRR) protein